MSAAIFIRTLLGGANKLDIAAFSKQDTDYKSAPANATAADRRIKHTTKRSLAFNNSVASRYAERKCKTDERTKEANKVAYLRHAYNEVVGIVTKL
ncbi:hypothetical protein D0T49_10895 [Paludibacter sp. 221]|uniref:hypothetical protein n=1 Tax=Paludibacter sp. 221 TaxID=2302939 RepID=UPI0013D0A9C9|nr:hypothetical protein [Paludibacter sp. 221]NDV47554.1 hypothetical protein [Paludibacter sp. 221]